MVMKLKGPKEGGREHFPFHLSYTYNLLPCRSDKAGPSVNAPRNEPRERGHGRSRGKLMGFKFPASTHHRLTGTR
jgi:hypothetical protein